jgi:hypothetical protein
LPPPPRTRRRKKTTPPAGEKPERPPWLIWAAAGVGLLALLCALPFLLGKGPSGQPAREESTPVVVDGKNLVVLATPHRDSPPSTPVPNPVPQPGFVSMFDGKTLESWRLSGPRGFWSVENGAIVADLSKAPNGEAIETLRWTGEPEQLRDFDLKFTISVQNSAALRPFVYIGVRYRVKDGSGYSFNIIAPSGEIGQLTRLDDRVISLADSNAVVSWDDLVKEDAGKQAPAAYAYVPGQPNEIIIHASAQDLRHKIHGQLCAMVRDESQRRWHERGALELFVRVDAPVAAKVEFRDLQLDEL